MTLRADFLPCELTAIPFCLPHRCPLQFYLARVVNNGGAHALPTRSLRVSHDVSLAKVSHVFIREIHSGVRVALAVCQSVHSSAHAGTALQVHRVYAARRRNVARNVCRSKTWGRGTRRQLRKDGFCGTANTPVMSGKRVAKRTSRHVQTT